MVIIYLIDFNLSLMTLIDLIYRNIIQITNILKTILGMAIILCLFGYSIFMTVTFCAVWQQWSTTLLFMWFMAIITDFILFEVVMEALLAVFFVLREHSFIFE